MTAFYNEYNAYAAQWLRNLSDAGHIAPGRVSEKDIRKVKAKHLRDYDQVHLFAGIGGWSYALRLAGWPDGLPVWTGSCPCQPFSNAGKREGFNDERHLWPEMFRLIRKCKPNIIFGEQVAGRDGLAWLDLVSSQMENEVYAFGAVDTCAAGLGAPEIRQRLYWVAISNSSRCRANRVSKKVGNYTIRSDGTSCRLGQSNGDRSCSRGETTSPLGQRRTSFTDGGVTRMADSKLYGLNKYEITRSSGSCKKESRLFQPERYDARNFIQPKPGPTNGFWRGADWLFGTDEFWRPVESGTFPLVDGFPGRVDQVRAYGNAIIPQQAAVFIQVVMEILGIEPAQRKRIRAK